MMVKLQSWKLLKSVFGILVLTNYVHSIHTVKLPKILLLLWKVHTGSYIRLRNIMNVCWVSVFIPILYRTDWCEWIVKKWRIVSMKFQCDVYFELNVYFSPWIFDFQLLRYPCIYYICSAVKVTLQYSTYKMKISVHRGAVFVDEREKKSDVLLEK